VTNATGGDNTASGYQSLANNTSGSDNTAYGVNALVSNSTGNNNIAVGYQAGASLSTGSNNIDIGNEGDAGDAGIIRIGTTGTQTETFIAGIVNSKLTGNEVVITSSGQLGVKASSERYKTDIAPMGSVSDKLGQLRPVSFHLKADPNGEVQYGLIAEEVVKVYPELVIRDAKGQIDGVRYDELAPMLLKEVQHQSAKIAEEHTAVASLVAQHETDATKIEQQAAKIASLEQKVADVDDLRQQLSAVIQDLKARDKLVAQR
jgi:hypothetical protein